MSVYHDPSHIVKVAKVNAWALAKPVFFVAFSLAMLFGLAIERDVPTPAWWLISLFFAMLFAAGQYYWIYLTRAVQVINLELEAFHTEETTGMTYGEYRVTRPTPPVSTGGRMEGLREESAG